MNTISIHNLDPELEALLREKARAKNQSLNKTIKEILEQSIVRKERKNQDRFLKFCGRWSEEEFKEFSGAIEDFNNIDPEEWK